MSSSKHYSQMSAADLILGPLLSFLDIRIPVEIRQYILHLLDPTSLCYTSFTCKSHYYYISQNTRLWMPLFLERFPISFISLYYRSTTNPLDLHNFLQTCLSYARVGTLQQLFGKAIILGIGSNFNEWGSDRVSPRYEKKGRIGEGTYGEVFQAEDTLTGEYVAIKKIEFNLSKRNGFPITSIREIRLLKALNHPNIVKLKNIVTSNTTYDQTYSIFMVFEYVDNDLLGLIYHYDGYKKIWLTEANIKSIIKQLLEALRFCHSHGIVHRDIKASNLLITKTGDCKLADFGLGRFCNNFRMTNLVTTLWYRAPELLVGSTLYGPEIDMWSVGCLLVELLIRRPLFPGRNEFDQLELIFQVCGTPNQENWSNYSDYPQVSTFQFKKTYEETLPHVLKDILSPKLRKLIRQMLSMDPRHRITAIQALESGWFMEYPLPVPPNFETIPACHELNERKTRRERLDKSRKVAQQQKIILSTLQTIGESVEKLEGVYFGLQEIVSEGDLFWDNESGSSQKVFSFSKPVAMFKPPTPTFSDRTTFVFGEKKNNPSLPLPPPANTNTVFHFGK